MENQNSINGAPQVPPSITPVPNPLAGSQPQGLGDDTMAFLAANTKPEALKAYGMRSVDDLPGRTPKFFPVESQQQVPLQGSQPERPRPPTLEEVIKKQSQAQQSPQGQSLSRPQPQPSVKTPEEEKAQVSPGQLSEQDLSVPSFDETPQTQETKQDEPSSQTTDPEPEVSGKEKSFADLRKTITKVNEDLRLKSQELSDLQTKLKRYEEGEEIPEKLKPQVDKVHELERYKTLHDFKVSEEYESKFLRPLQGLKQKASRLAEEYRVDPQVIEAALNSTSVRERDRILMDHFGDVGARKVDDIISQMSEIQTGMKEAEKEPFKAFEAAKAEAARLRAEQQARDLKDIEIKAKNAWVKSLTKYNEGGQYPELQIIPGDEEQNAISRPIITKASKELASFVKILVASGLKNIPEGAMEVLAERFQLSEAYHVAAAHRAELHNSNYEIQKQAQARRGILRPGTSNMGGAAGTTGRPEAKKITLDDVLREGNALAASRRR